MIDYSRIPNPLDEYQEDSNPFVLKFAGLKMQGLFRFFSFDWLDFDKQSSCLDFIVSGANTRRCLAV